MRCAFIPAFVLVLFGLTATLSAQEGDNRNAAPNFDMEVPVGGPDLDYVLQRYYAMNGGRSNMLNIQSMRVEAIYTTGGGISGTLTQIKKRPDYVLTKWEAPDGMVVRHGSNGQVAWERISRPGFADHYQYQPRVPEGVFESLLVYPEASLAKLELLPDEVLVRDDCYVVRATLPSGHTKTYWLEKESMKELQVKEVDAQGVETVLKLEQHFKEKGIWFPGVQYQEDSKGVSTLKVNDVQINIGLLPGLFDPPAPLLEQAPAGAASAQ